MDTLTTSDLGLATFLYCIGAELRAIDRQNPRRSGFIFAVSPDQAKSLSQWQSGTARVNALAFWNSFQVVKRRLFGQGERGA